MKTIIIIEGLKKKFGDFTAVDGLILGIYKNEIFGLPGSNKVGKTNAINMICGLLPASEGEIAFADYPGKNRKSVIGCCPQENIFYPRLTCLEQLLFMGGIFSGEGI